MSTTIDTILHDAPWDDHGVYVNFDRQGRATILSDTDDRYVRIAATQVSGVSRSDHVNGLVVTLHSATKGELDRQGYEFAQHGIPATLTGIDNRKGGERAWFWQQGGGPRYDGHIDWTELVEAVAGFLATVGMLGTPLGTPAPAAAPGAPQLDQRPSLVLALGDGSEWGVPLSGLVAGHVAVQRTDGDSFIVRVSRIDEASTGPADGESIYGHLLDAEGIDTHGSELEFRLDLVTSVVFL